MLRTLAASLLLVFWLAAAHTSPALAGPGWTQLFNGRDLNGWKHVGPGGMTVVDGEIHTAGGMGLLYWGGAPIGNCTLRVVYRMRDENDNSGVFIRIPIEPREEWMPVYYGYEVQIDERDDDYHRTGDLYSFNKAQAKSGKPGPAWNVMEITLRGNRTLVTLNGKQVTDWTDTPAAQASAPARVHTYEPQRGVRPDRGWFGLQNHSDADVVYFKEVAIKPLPE